MLKEINEIEMEKSRVFQVLLLQNDASLEVEIEEGKKVDFLRVQNHLNQGGSVFITSKNSQKLNLLKKKERICRNTNETKTLENCYFHHL